MSASWILKELGRRIRAERESLGMSLSELAERSELSRRYLTETEAGRANPSLLKLVSLARVLHLSMARLCDLPVRKPAIRRLALVGLRGAGKSTVGRKLAFSLDRPFVELDRLIVKEGGLSLAEVFRSSWRGLLSQAGAFSAGDLLIKSGREHLGYRWFPGDPFGNL